MGARRLAGAVLLALLLALGATAPAIADEQLTPSGSLILAWHGDPTRGCAQIGVCGVNGVLIVRPNDDVSFVPGRGPGGELDFLSVVATARVAGSGSGVCVEDGTDLQSDGSLMVRLSGGGARPDAANLSSGRCAGPVEGGISRFTLPLRRSGARHSRFDLTGGAVFTAGPYSGTVTSTLRMVPDTASGSSSSLTSSSSGGGRGARTRTVLYEEASLDYRVSVAPSTLTTAFTGAGDPFCLAIDACGASGTLALTAAADQGGTTLVFSRQISRRLNRTRILADLRADRLVLETPAPLPIRFASLSETFTGSGSFTCRDQHPVHPATIGAFAGGFSNRPVRSLPFSIQQNGPPDFLRTACPGPEVDDVFPAYAETESARLASAQVSVAALLARRSSVTLRAAGAFSTSSYAGTRSGVVTIGLTLVRRRARVVAVREPVS